MQKLARDLNQGDKIRFRGMDAPVVVRTVSKRATSGGCVVAVFIEGQQYCWKSFRGSQKVNVVEVK